jgi:hypothetical protein
MFSDFPTCVKLGKEADQDRQQMESRIWIRIGIKTMPFHHNSVPRFNPSILRGAADEAVLRKKLAEKRQENTFSGRKHSLCWHPYLLVKINKDRLAGFANTAAARDLLELVGPGHGRRMRKESLECRRYSMLEKIFVFFAVKFYIDEINNNGCLYALD